MADAIALQWSLNQTTDHFLKVGKELMIAASKDDVQPLTLLACCQFGATLPICEYTRSKIQVLLKQQADPVVLKFIKAQVGFVKGTSVDLLSQSLAGVNFLGLVVPLLSMSSSFEAGQALEGMITATATDKTLVPSSHHLEGLINILEPRLNRADFLNEVFGWRDFLSSFEGSTIGPAFTGDTYPGPPAFPTLVGALRELARIGEVHRIVLKVRNHLPWLCALIKWCLGLPPTILHGADQHIVLEQPGSTVTLVYDQNMESEKLIVELIRESATINELIVSNMRSHEVGVFQSYCASGMIGISEFGAQRLKEVTQRRDTVFKQSLITFLPSALELVYSGATNAGKMKHRTSSGGSIFPNPFNSFDILLQVLHLYLSSEKSELISDKDSGAYRLPDAIRDWNAAESLKKWLLSLPTFWFSLSILVSDIFALSMFDGYFEHLMLYYPQTKVSSSRSDNRLLALVIALLNPEEKVRYFVNQDKEIPDAQVFDRAIQNPAEAVLDYALQLVDHRFANELRNNTWVASASHGQVVFPELFQTQQIVESGFFKLASIPGTLNFSADFSKPFSLVKSMDILLPPADQEMEREVKKRVETSQTSAPETIQHRCENWLRSMELRWHVRESKDCIFVGLGQKSNWGCLEPLAILQGMCFIQILQSCPHDPQKPYIPSKDDSLMFSTPLAMTGFSYSIAQNRSFKAVGRRRVNILPVYGDNNLRLLAIATAWEECRAKHINERGAIIVNNRACLECLMNLDQDRHRYIIM